MVQAQLRREEDRSTISEADFLAAAAPVVTCAQLHDTADERFARASELVGKTNQFNTTGRRWTSTEWASFFANGGAALTFSATDAYTQYGLVGVILYRGDTIEQFVMSCRVLGYGVEQAVLSHLVAFLRANGAAEIVARLVETNANFPCRDVYAKAGFVARGQDWVLDANASPKAPAHVRVD
jgi:FkbH-like protein